MNDGKKIRVLVVDDSALARLAIADALSHDPAIEVVGFAEDPYRAREMILALTPDVVTLDLQMPRMDGLTFLRILMEHHPVPVIIVSNFTPAGSALALQALEAGAVDVIQKSEGHGGTARLASRLTAHIHAAAGSRRHAGRALPAERLRVSASDWEAKVIVIGSSTGGVEALRYLLPQLPADVPPIVVAQHIPPHFSGVMAEHLNHLTAFEVREAVDGDDLHHGLCLIAPGDYHVTLQRVGSELRVRTVQSPPVNHSRPSVDVLFRSAAEQAGVAAVGVLLTGMGSDGARGLSLIRSVGGATLVEAEESCVVFGMPQAAIRLDAAQQVLPLETMAEALLAACRRKGSP